MPNSIRLTGWDYRNDGYYFVTICTKDRREFFGDVINEIMHMSPLGDIVKNEWLKMFEIRDNVEIDEYIIMPNHLHLLIRLFGHGIKWNEPYDYSKDETINPLKFITPKPKSLSSIIGVFKSIVSRKCHEAGDLDFAWQPGFYDQIVQDEHVLPRIRQYITNNPKNWNADYENLDCEPDIKKSRRQCKIYKEYDVLLSEIG